LYLNDLVSEDDSSRKKKVSPSKRTGRANQKTPVPTNVCFKSSPKKS